MENNLGSTTTTKEFPKLLFGHGKEPEVEKINNSCRLSILRKIKDALPIEYEKVKSDPLFAQVFAIYENDTWKDDKGFWSKLLKREEKICIKTMMSTHLGAVHKWCKVDRIRFVYLCVIAGLVIAKDEKKAIPVHYIKLVMDLEKLRAYPWGLHSFDYLVESITNAKKDLKKTKSYALDGFSIALQIWAMEAVPKIGGILGVKLNKNLGASLRCSNWKGAAKVSYQEIIELETGMTAEDIVYPYISITGNYDVYESVDFLRQGENSDVALKNLNALIRTGYDFSDFEWDAVESPDVEEETIDEDLVEDGYVEGQGEIHTNDKEEANVTVEGSLLSGLQSNEHEMATSSKKRRSKDGDHGAQTRKMKLLCQRAPAAPHGFDEEMKTFIREMFETSFKHFGQEVSNKLGKIELDVATLKKAVITMDENSKKDKAPPFGNGQPVDDNCLFHELFTRPGEIDLNMDSQDPDFLQKEMGHLSQKSQAPGFDPSQGIFSQNLEKQQRKDDTAEFMDWNDKGDSGKYDADAVLVYLPEARWTAFEAWFRNVNRDVPKLGPSHLTDALFKRLIDQKEWLGNDEIDAVLYLHRESTSLRRLNSARVGFMSCEFSARIKNEYPKFMKNKKTHKWDSRLIDFVTGESPSHGKTGKSWALDFDRIYAPVNVNNSHWISICVNFVLRTVEVFDCFGNNNRRNVEMFAYIIPRIVKDVHGKVYGKVPLLTQYEIINVKVPKNLNTTMCDCGVYALKHIECHMLNLSMDLINDGNIKEARMKIAVDLWEAAHDPILIERMKNYKPPHQSSDILEID
ncbi:hypothetical protein ARALYDRAFT_337235 [Arabidopsis lyrata subsp. lyrata]|uniref:Ubiquitin-like protease family profile domain-containing protein n=3 Tax=Arabidopsis lyrata subsp. lyrata TaxID=81972 RepID=D7KGT4_ARALL|nr:hypothetical protein ARALYDRAFT_337235 [Arabidopsis lyrata subsp. lyrata]